MALTYFACAVVTCIFTMIVIDVSIRTMGFTPPGFTLAVVEYSLLWFAMCSAPYLVRNRGHVTIEALVSILPPVVRWVLAKMVYLVCCGVALLFAYFSTILLIDAWISQVPDIRGIDMPYWTMFLPMPLSFLLIAIEFVRYLIGPHSYYSYDLGEVKDTV